MVRKDGRMRKKEFPIKDGRIFLKNKEWSIRC